MTRIAAGRYAVQIVGHTIDSKPATKPGMLLVTCSCGWQAETVRTAVHVERLVRYHAETARPELLLTPLSEGAVLADGLSEITLTEPLELPGRLP